MNPTPDSSAPTTNSAEANAPLSGSGKLDSRQALEASELPRDLRRYSKLIRHELESASFAEELSRRLWSEPGFATWQAPRLLAERAQITDWKAKRVSEVIRLYLPIVSLERFSLRHFEWVGTAEPVPDQAALQEVFRSQVLQLLNERAPEMREAASLRRRQFEEIHRLSLAILRASDGKLSILTDRWGKKTKTWSQETAHLNSHLRHLEWLLAELELADEPVYSSRQFDLETWSKDDRGFNPTWLGRESGTFVSRLNAATPMMIRRKENSILAIDLAERTGITWSIEIDRYGERLDEWREVDEFLEPFESAGLLGYQIERITFVDLPKEDMRIRVVAGGRTLLADFDSKRKSALREALAELASDLTPISAEERRERESFAPGKIGDRRDGPPEALGRPRTPEQLEWQRSIAGVMGMGIMDIFDAMDPRHRIEFPRKGIVATIEGERTPAIPYQPFETVRERFAEAYLPLRRASDSLRQRSEWWGEKSALEAQSRELLIQVSASLPLDAIQDMLQTVRGAIEAVPCDQWRYDRQVRFDLSSMNALQVEDGSPERVVFRVAVGTTAEELAEQLRPRVLSE